MLRIFDARRPRPVQDLARSFVFHLEPRRCYVMENEMIPLHNGKLNCQRPRITATFFASTFFTSSHALELRDDLGSGESDYAAQCEEML